MGDLYDFDAAWAEEADDPVRFRLLGQEWACHRPSQVPAALILRLDRLMTQVARMQATGDTPDDLVVDEGLSTESIARQLAGDANVDAWLDGVPQDDGTVATLPYPRLAQVVRRLLAIYRGQDPDQGEAPAANRTQRRAAANGNRSRSRTS